LLFCSAAEDGLGLVCTWPVEAGFEAFVCAGVAGEGLAALVGIGVAGEGLANVCFPCVGGAGIGVAGEGFPRLAGFVLVPGVADGEPEVAGGADFTGPLGDDGVL
jgi:hypothetical protein